MKGKEYLKGLGIATSADYYQDTRKGVVKRWLIADLLDNYQSEVNNNSHIQNVMPALVNYKECRKQKGLTLRKVEEITGISNSYLSQLETGKIKSPSFDVIKKLYDLYNEA